LSEKVHFRFRYGRAFLAFVAAGLVALPVVYMIAITLVPNVTSDGHPVMPIGQAAFAILVAPFVGGYAAYRAGRVR